MEVVPTKRNGFLFLNGFALKIIALVLMTIDHIGFFFLTGTTLDVFRSIGRLALPLFIFLSVEAIYHSRKPYKYAITLIILGFTMDLVTGLFTAFTNYYAQIMVGNVFTLLGLGSLACILIKRYDKYSLLAIFPLAYCVLSSFKDIFSPYINCDYGVYGITMYLFFFFSYELVTKILQRTSEKAQIDFDIVKDIYERKYRNYYCVLALILHTAIFYLLYRIDYSSPLIPFSYNIQSWAMFAGLFIFFYNGKRGFSNTIVKYGFYVYYPAHVLLLALISSLI